MVRGPRRARSALAILLALPWIVPAPGTTWPSAHASTHTDRLRVTAPSDSGVLVHGTYPRRASSCKRTVQPVLHARFRGTVEVGRDTDGSLFLINEIPFEQYLEGIAEVPRSWPMQALKAQVVAARSYALSRMARPDTTGGRLGYQLCATDACQVYRGMGISHGPYGDRWRRAVRETAGEVILYRGRPADTVYSSTSPGYTLGNEEVFGGDPVPYLRPVKERDDGASPLSRWRAEFLLRDLARFLRASGHWSDRPIRSVERRGSVVVVRGGGRRERIPVAEFRRHMNQWASCLVPERYPGAGKGGSRLPQAVPSVWFDAETRGRRVVMRGRGWGHAVGMVQWGAYGKARRGLTYREILSAYYGGLRPKVFDAPATIRVGVAVGLRSLQIEGQDGLVVEGARAEGLGPWRVTGGRRLRVREGSALPRLVAAGSIREAPQRARAGRRVRVEVSVPQLSVVGLILRGLGAEARLSASTVPAGPATIRVRIPDDVATGAYRIAMEVTDGIDVVVTEGRRIRVVGKAVASPSPSPSLTPTPKGRSPAPTATAPPTGLPETAGTPAGSSRGAWTAWAAVGGLAVALILGAGLVYARRRG